MQAEDGLIPTTISQLFKTVNEDKEYEYSVFLSYLQIYHERIYDLLDSSNETDLHLREHPDEGLLIHTSHLALICAKGDSHPSQIYFSFFSFYILWLWSQREFRSS